MLQGHRLQGEASDASGSTASRILIFRVFAGPQNRAIPIRKFIVILLFWGRSLAGKLFFRKREVPRAAAKLLYYLEDKNAHRVARCAFSLQPPSAHCGAMV
jgi:hypothetical protein